MRQSFGIVLFCVKPNDNESVGIFTKISAKQKQICIFVFNRILYKKQYLVQKSGHLMERIVLDQDIRPLSDFRANTAALIQQVRATKRPLVLTQHGKSAAVILDVSEYEALLDKIELLQEIHTAEQQLNSGLGIPHEKAKKNVLNHLRKKG